MILFDVLTFVGVIGCLLFFGLFKNRSVQSESSYLFAERKCNVWQLTCTLVMTEMNTSTLFSFAGLGYLAGIRALSLPLVFFIGLIFYALTVAKKWKNLDAYSVVELFRKRYGETLAKLASLALITAMIGFTATYVKSLSLLFHPLFPNFSPWVISLILIGITLMMTLRGGLVAIIRTDILSFLLMCLIIPTILFVSYRAAPKTSLVFPEAAQILPTRFVVSLIFLTMFTYILAPWYGQKIFSARSPKVARTSVGLAAILVFLFYGAGVLATAYLKGAGISLNSPDEGIPLIVQSLLPTGMKGLAFATLFAICATTLSGVWSAMSAMVIADFWKCRPEGNYKRGLMLTLAFASISYLLGNTLVDRILAKLILANIPVAALAFALLAGFYSKKVSPFGAFLSIIVGLGWGIGCYLHFGEAGLYTWYWAIYGLPLTFLSGIIGSYLKPLPTFQRNTR
ncbi:MAG: hypothetical protein KDK59_06375 [Simkania sp.]|nr:hypothetical protein [Simkania sp.]